MQMSSMLLPIEYSLSCTNNLTFAPSNLHFFSRSGATPAKALAVATLRFPEIQNSAAQSLNHGHISLLSSLILPFFLKKKNPLMQNAKRGFVLIRLQGTKFLNKSKGSKRPRPTRRLLAHASEPPVVDPVIAEATDMHRALAAPAVKGGVTPPATGILPMDSIGMFVGKSLVVLVDG